MADRIRLTVSETQQAANIFSRNSQELITMLNSLTSEKNALMAGWLGDSANAFSGEFDKLSQIVNQFAQFINQTGQQIQNAGQKMQETDTRVSSTLQR